MKERGGGAAAFAVGEGDLAVEVAQRVARNGEAHADADRVLGTDERLEDAVADFRVDAAALVVDADLEEPAVG